MLNRYVSSMSLVRPRGDGEYPLIGKRLPGRGCVSASSALSCRFPQHGSREVLVSVRDGWPGATAHHDDHFSLLGIGQLGVAFLNSGIDAKDVFI